MFLRALGLAILALNPISSAQAAEFRFSTITFDKAVQPKLKAALSEGEPWAQSIIQKGGVEGPGEIVRINGKPYRYAESCRPHMCSDYALAVLVGPDGQPYFYAFGSEVRDGILGPRPPEDVVGTFLTRTVNR